MAPQYDVPAARYATLARYGITKEALDSGSLGRAATWLFRNHPAPNYGSGFWNTTKGLVHNGANFAREIAVGSPVEAWTRFRQDAKARGSHLGAYGQMLKDYYWAPHDQNATAWGRAGRNFDRALGLGFTGLDLYQAVTGDPAQRKGDLAAAATGAILGPITGSMGWKLGPLVHTAITNGVRSVAHRFDPPTEPPTPLTQETPSALPHIRRAIRAHKMLAGGELNPSELFEGD